MTLPAPPTTLVDDLVTIRQWSQGVPSVAFPEIDTINAFIGDGTNTLAPGIAAAIRVDFNSLITGSYIQEVDGDAGSIVLAIGKSQRGGSPSFTSIVGSSPPTISGGRSYADEDLVGWNRTILRGDMLLFSITSVAGFTRLLISLRIRRLEP